MRLKVVQEFRRVSVGQVAAAYGEPELYGAFAALPFGGGAEVLMHKVHDDGKVSLAVRYRIEADLPSAAAAFVDPDKLTFIEYATLQPDGSGEFDIVPDHYGHMLSASGSIALDDSPVRRTLTGELDVDLGWAGALFEGQAERGIATGLQRVAQAQVDAVETFILDQS